MAVATGDGIRRIFHSLGVQGIVTGGQSMNPSTAELLEAVETVPADQVVILPNNKNIIPVAEQVDEHTTKTVRRGARPRGITEGFAALLAYDPEAEATTTPRRWREAAGNVVAGEVTQAVRDSSCDVGPIAEGDWLGIARDGISAVEAPAGRRRHRLLLEASSPTTTRSSRSSRARARRPARPGASPSGSASTGRRRRPRSTTAASRSTRTSSGSSSAAPWPAVCARSPRSPSPSSTGVGPERAKALRSIGLDSILDLLTHYPRRYVDKTKQSSIRDLAVDEQALGASARSCRRRRCRGGAGGKARTELRISDGSGYLRVTFFNQPWRARQLPQGTEAMFFGKVTELPRAEAAWPTRRST